MPDPEDTFTCAECGALRCLPGAASDDYDYDDGDWRACGKPICQDCARRGSSCPEYAHLIADGGPAHG